MASRINIEKVVESILNLQTLCTTFLNVLYKEFNAVEKLDPDALINCANEKQQLIEQLASQESLIRTEINPFQFTAPLQELLRSFIATIEDQHSKANLNSNIENLSKLLVECKNQNQINGKIIQGKMEFNKNFMRIFLKQDYADDCQIYNEKGKVS